MLIVEQLLTRLKERRSLLLDRNVCSETFMTSYGVIGTSHGCIMTSAHELRLTERSGRGSIEASHFREEVDLASPKKCQRANTLQKDKVA